MKPLSLAALLISINLSFVNANPFEDEHRSLLSGGEAAAEVSVVEKYTCKSIIAIGKIRDSGGKGGFQVSSFSSDNLCKILTKYLTNIPPINVTADNR